MKRIWTITLKTSLPDFSTGPEDLKTWSWAFDSFEAARNGARAILKKLSFGKSNAMFNGRGTLKSLKEYEDNEWEPEDKYDYEGEEIDPKETVKLIRAVCSGKDTGLAKGVDDFYDGTLTITTNTDEITVKSDGAYFSTNMLAMFADRHYYFYVDDYFMSNLGAQLYLDLIPTTLLEKKKPG